MQRGPAKPVLLFLLLSDWGPCGSSLPAVPVRSLEFHVGDLLISLQ